MFCGFRAPGVLKKRDGLQNLERKRVIGSNSKSCVKSKKICIGEVIVHDKVMKLRIA